MKKKKKGAKAEVNYTCEGKDNIVLKSGVLDFGSTTAITEGYKYSGQFKININNGIRTFVRHGKGKLFNENIDIIYEGEWKDDRMHGQGTFTFNNAVYVGGFKNDKRHGQGTLTYFKGDKYVGEWDGDQRHGKGTFTFASGDKYVGEFGWDKYHGQGTYTFGDGRVDQGTFVNDQFTGISKLTEQQEKTKSKNQGYIKRGSLSSVKIPKRGSIRDQRIKQVGSFFKGVAKGFFPKK